MTDLAAAVQKAKAAGYSDDQITSYLANDKAFGSKVQAAQAHGYNPAEIVGFLSKPARVGPAAGFMANVNRGTGVGDELAAGTRAALNSAGKLLQGQVPNVGEEFRGAMARQRALEGAYAAEHPTMAALARGTGNAATAAIPAGKAVQAVALAPRLANVARGAVTGAIGAAGYAVADHGTVGERLKAAGDPAVLAAGAVAGGIGGALGPAARKAPKPSKGSEAVRLLSREGVQLTPGQMAGKTAKRMEEMATAVPITGHAIVGAQERALHTFNQAAINRTLRPIGEALPKDMGAGHDAVKFAGDRLSAGYQKALGGVNVKIDNRFAASMSRINPIVARLTATDQDRLKTIIRERLVDRFSQGGTMTGTRLKQVDSEISSLARDFSKSEDPDKRALGEALGMVRENLMNAVARQNPGTASRLRALNAGWANLVRVERAATQSKEGIFTPEGLQNAVKATDSSARKRSVARGDAVMQDLAKAGVQVIGNRFPSSGTAERRLMQEGVRGAVGLVGGGTAGVAAGLPGMIATGAVLGAGAAPYTRPASALINRALTNHLAAASATRAVPTPAVQNLLSRVPRTAGVIAGSNALSISQR